MTMVVWGLQKLVSQSSVATAGTTTILTAQDLSKFPNRIFYVTSDGPSTASVVVDESPDNSTWVASYTFSGLSSGSIQKLVSNLNSSVVMGHWVRMTGSVPSGSASLKTFINLNSI